MRKIIVFLLAVCLFSALAFVGYRSSVPPSLERTSTEGPLSATGPVSGAVRNPVVSETVPATPLSGADVRPNTILSQGSGSTVYDAVPKETENGILVASKTNSSGTYRYEWYVIGDTSDRSADGRSGTALFARVKADLANADQLPLCSGYSYYECMVRVMDERSGKTVLVSTGSAATGQSDFLNPVGWIDDTAIRFENAIGGEWWYEALSYDVKKKESMSIYRIECGLKGGTVSVGKKHYRVNVGDNETEWIDADTGKVLQTIAQISTDAKDGCPNVENDTDVSLSYYDVDTGTSIRYSLDGATGKFVKESSDSRDIPK